MSKGYATNADLPKAALALPENAQDVFRIAYNNAVAGGHKVPDQEAWAAVAVGWEWDGAVNAWRTRAPTI